MKTLFGTSLLIGLCLGFYSCEDDISSDSSFVEPTLVRSDLVEDIKLPVSSATASSFQPGANIEASFDGDISTLYHSNWTNNIPNYFPITLTYDFDNVESMDYLVYYPRPIGSNGNFKEFEIYVATEDNPNLVKVGDYDFGGSSSSSMVLFYPALVKPTKVEFRIKSGVNNFVACGEMEFYKSMANSSLDLLSIFTDYSCSALKSEITKADVDAIENPVIRNLATQLLENTYDKEFRVQTYKAWQKPSVMAKVNKTSEYSLRDNPTGVYSVANEDLIVFMGETDQNISLLVQDPDGGLSGQSFALRPGFNRVKPTISGLIYIMYHTTTGTEDPVKINIVTGKVNGYFDSQKHTKEDWSRLLATATFRHFDLVGRRAHMTFETEAFRKYTPDGLALINKYDELVRLENDFMGLFKYNKEFKNRMYMLVVNTGYMFASGNYTGYHYNTQSSVLNVNQSGFDGWWGPAHEIGHMNQTRPGLKWKGMGEVTNNIFSLYVATTFGMKSRLMYTGKDGKTNYELAKDSIIYPHMPHNQLSKGDAVLYKLAPFWQLKLYLVDAQGMTDFYKDVFEKVRTSPDLSDAKSQLQFVKFCCDVAKLDLTDFFTKWGFLYPIDQVVDDYGSVRFTITQAEINECLNYIHSKGYPKPLHDNIEDITDANVALFK